MVRHYSVLFTVACVATWCGSDSWWGPGTPQKGVACAARREVDVDANGDAGEYDEYEDDEVRSTDSARVSPKPRTNPANDSALLDVRADRAHRLSHWVLLRVAPRDCSHTVTLTPRYACRCRRTSTMMTKTSTMRT